MATSNGGFQTYSVGESDFEDSMASAILTGISAQVTKLSEILVIRKLFFYVTLSDDVPVNSIVISTILSF